MAVGVFGLNYVATHLPISVLGFTAAKKRFGGYFFFVSGWQTRMTLKKYTMLRVDRAVVVGPEGYVSAHIATPEAQNVL